MDMTIEKASGKRRKYMRRKRWPLLLAMAVFIVMIALSVAKLIAIGREYKEGQDTYKDIANAVLLHEKNDVPKEEVAPVPTLEDEDTVALDLQLEQNVIVDFSVLQAINGDAQGWLQTADGAINYPIVQGSDNEYYLNHMIDGTVNNSGSLFMDFRNASDLSDRNTFVYGHNMRNGTMFGRLEDMGSAELELITPTGQYRLKGFAGYSTPGNSDIYQIDFLDDAEYEQYLKRIRLLSEFDSDIAVSVQDRIVTLSTCAYDYDDARYVLHCKIEKLDDGGDADE